MGKKNLGNIIAATTFSVLLALVPISIYFGVSAENEAKAQAQAQAESLKLMNLKREIDREPVPIPVTMMWPVAESEITSHFGPRDTTGCWACDSYHTGLDLAGPWGQPIPAATAGTVTVVGWHHGLGYWIVISDGSRSYVYGHLAAYSNPPEVYVGAQVQMGQIIGLMGSTGYSMGPHLHFEIWENNTTPIDPYPILKEQTVQRYK